VDKSLTQYLNERGPVKLYEKIQQLEAERDALIEIVEAQKLKLKMNHSERLHYDVEKCTSPGKLQVVAIGHLIEAIRSLNPALDMMALIEEFRNKFRVNYEGGPRFLPKDISKLQLQHLHEELKEYRDAVDEKNLEKQLDALVDLVYVTLGTAHLHGFDFNEAFRRIHAANMKKTRARSGKESKRGSSFDVIKPPGWKPPYLGDLI